MQSRKSTFQAIIPAELAAVVAFAIIFDVVIIHVVWNNEFVALGELTVASKHEYSIRQTATALSSYRLRSCLQILFRRHLDVARAKGEPGCHIDF